MALDPDPDLNPDPDPDPGRALNPDPDPQHWEKIQVGLIFITILKKLTR